MLNILKESIDELAAKSSGLYHVPFGLHQFFFPNVFIENVNWILMNFKGKEKRAAFLTKLYWFIAAKHLVYNALKKLRSISCLLKYKRIISWLC